MYMKTALKNNIEKTLSALLFIVNVPVYLPDLCANDEYDTLRFAHSRQSASCHR